MKSKSLEELSELQKMIMEMAWEQGEVTVYEVLDSIKSEKRIPYTTVLSAMQVLTNSGWLKHRTKNRTYIYSSKMTREQVGKRSIQSLVNSVFQGNSFMLFQHFIHAQELNKEDLTKLQKMINQRKKEMKDE